MLRKDIPLSAVDFHVSSIIEEMVNVSEIAQKAKVGPFISLSNLILLLIKTSVYHWFSVVITQGSVRSRLLLELKSSHAFLGLYVV